ncbi:putative molybdenum carrier protein [Noviherbaspirillum pedocola]|uniref:putative molybdenum carrier protein n=1 Tax=Noviherbaspirillum pedocola TaxID=2801341 RepID=UPI001F231263|nr:putative molybdenum carrier protein [Noviherbaspirillum pedocola]
MDDLFKVDSGFLLMSGGQTGADRAGLDWAIAHGIPHGGWCPQGRRSEDGPIAARYCLVETPSRSYLQRTEWNVRDSDATLVFTLDPILDGGSRRTAVFADKHGKAGLHVHPGILPTSVVHFLFRNRVTKLNIVLLASGNLPPPESAALPRKRSAPHCGQWVGLPISLRRDSAQSEKYTAMTFDIQERLIYEGDSYLLDQYPLEPYLALMDKRPFTPCWPNCSNGYVAEWEIFRDSLFLVKLSSGGELPLNTLFATASSSVLASWYSGVLRCYRGEHRRTGPTARKFFNDEIFLEIEDGLVTRRWILDLRDVPDQTDEEIRQSLPSFLWPERFK